LKIVSESVECMRRSETGTAVCSCKCASGHKDVDLLLEKEISRLSWV